MSENYHDAIDMLDDRRQCREKVSIWFGSAENFVHPIKELLANSSDEIINNFDSGEVILTLHDDMRTITVEDTGRGIQLGGETVIKNEREGDKTFPNYELLFLTLFAGTKYEENSDSTTGTNGVGTSVINYTSELFDVTSWYGGNEYRVVFENGATNNHKLQVKKCSKDKHGTKITVRLDDTVYVNPNRKDGKVYFRADVVEDIVKRFAISSNKLTTVFKHKDKEVEYHYEDTLDYFDGIIGNSSTSDLFTTNRELYTDGGEKTEIDVIVTTTPDIVQETYLNSTFLEENGSIYEGVIQGVRGFCNDYCTENNLFPRGTERFIKSDIENSISFVAVMMSNNVEFENQTKLSTQKRLYRTVTEKHTNEIMQVMSMERPKEFKKMIDHLLLVQKNNNVNRRANRRLRNELTKNVSTIGNRVKDLVDCEVKGMDSEIYIAEGKSALGSVIDARNPKYQAGYPLTGKTLNCINAPMSRILDTEIIKEIVNILGCGIVSDNEDLHTFDIDNLRYGKVIITVDADPDGSQIFVLLLSMFYRLMPQLLTDGYIYLAHTPLYEAILKNGESVYFYSEQEYKEGIGEIKEPYELERRKGLGEMEMEKMKETAMDKDTRKLIKIKVDDLDKFGNMLEKWLQSGADFIGMRKNFIDDNLDEYLEIVKE